MDKEIKKIETGARSCDVYLTPPFVVDAGSNPKIVSSTIKDLGLQDELKYIFLTHSHFDHIAATYDLKKEFDLDVISHKLTKKAVEQKNDDLTLSNMFKEKIKDFEVNIVIEKEEDIEDSKVLLTPGHSDSGISLVQEKRKKAFIGDLFFPGARAARTDLFTGNIKKLKKSLKKLSKLNIKQFFTGHGGLTTKEELYSVLNQLNDINERNI